VDDRSLGSVLTAHGRDVLDHLDRESAVPVADFARQGDVLVVPDRIRRVWRPAATPLPAAGIAVVRGRSPHAVHLLVGEGPVAFDALPSSPEMQTLGVLGVGEGGTAFLIHPEHGAVGFPPGDYTVVRQREQADVARFVED
jgi:hypothetical protein